MNDKLQKMPQTLLGGKDSNYCKDFFLDVGFKSDDNNLINLKSGDCLGLITFKYLKKTLLDVSV